MLVVGLVGLGVVGGADCGWFRMVDGGGCVCMWLLVVGWLGVAQWLWVGCAVAPLWPRSGPAEDEGGGPCIGRGMAECSLVPERPDTIAV